MSAVASMPRPIYDLAEDEGAEWVLAAALRGEAVVDTGQLNDGTRQLLDREVRRGRLVKWRGKWFPQAGAPFGIGPPKRCWSSVNPWADFKEPERPQ